MFNGFINAIRESRRTAFKLRLYVIYALVLYASSFAGGYMMSLAGLPVAHQVKQMIQEMVLTLPPFTGIIEALRRGGLLEAILRTFWHNLSFGAFLTTTLPGFIPIVGTVGISTVSILRGLLIGVLYFEVLKVSAMSLIVGLGTLILEFGAYVFSTAAGMRLSLAPFLHKREPDQTRLKALLEAAVDMLRIYPIVALMLAAGAAWEMIGLSLTLPLNLSSR